MPTTGDFVTAARAKTLVQLICGEPDAGQTRTSSGRRAWRTQWEPTGSGRSCGCGRFWSGRGGAPRAADAGV